MKEMREKAIQIHSTGNINKPSLDPQEISEVLCQI